MKISQTMKHIGTLLYDAMYIVCWIAFFVSSFSYYHFINYNVSKLLSLHQNLLDERVEKLFDVLGISAYLFGGRLYFWSFIFFILLSFVKKKKLKQYIPIMFIMLSMSIVFMVMIFSIDFNNW